MHSALLPVLETSTLREAPEAVTALSAGAPVAAVGDPFRIDLSLERTYATRARIVGMREDAESKRLLAAIEEFVANLSRHIGTEAQWLRIGNPTTWHFLCCQSVAGGQLLGCMRVRQAEQHAAGGGTSAA